jgi:hypothetical protein
MFVRDPFDIAPNASRHTRASWLTLALGLVFMLLSGVVLDRSVLAMKQAEESTTKQREMLQTQADGKAAARRNQTDPAALARAQAQQKLQHILRMSWSGLFDALESAGRKVDGGTVVLSLAPTRTQADAAEVGVTALAVSSQVMVDYIRALESNAHVREVQLTMQQPAVSGTAQVVRFQLAILWDPRGNPPARPAGEIR